jgi:hypothetical protein
VPVKGFGGAIANMVVPIASRAASYSAARVGR